MATQADIMAAVANEARIREAKIRISGIQGRINALGSLAQDLTSMGDDAERLLQRAKQDLAAIEAGSGAGVTDDFGEYSSTDQAMRAERFAGKAAAVAFIKANPGCTEDNVRPIYEAAALAIRPADRKWLLNNTDGLSLEYRANLIKYSLISDNTWESWRDWVVATDTDTILGLG